MVLQFKTTNGVIVILAQKGRESKGEHFRTESPSHYIQFFLVLFEITQESNFFQPIDSEEWMGKNRAGKFGQHSGNLSSLSLEYVNVPVIVY